MKKLIAISALLTLLAVAAFAQPSLGGHFGVQVNTFKSQTGEDANGDPEPVVAGINIKGSRVNVDFNNSDGTAGGRVRLSGRASEIGWWGALPFAFAWWKPIPQLRIQIGHNPDGDWGAAQISGWGMNAEAQDSVAIDQDSSDPGSSAARKARTGNLGGNAQPSVFYGGYSELGALLSIYPAEGLTFNIALPFGNGRAEGDKGIGNIYTKFHLNIVYSIPDIGTVRVTFQGLGGFNNDDEDTKVSLNTTDASPGTIYASFFLTAIDDLALDLGVSYGLPWEDDAKKTTTPGLGVGLGVRFTSGDFGIRVRAAAGLAGSTKADGAEAVNEPTIIGFGILPSFAVAGMTIYLNAGVGISIPDGDDPFIGIDWFVNPYLRKSVSNLSFYAGVKIGTPGAPDKDNDAVIGWAVPIGFNCYF